MKFFVAVALAALAGQSSAHYIWQAFGSSTPYQYVRINSNQNSPVIDLKSNDLRCNVGGGTGNVSVITMAAGAQGTWTLDTAVYHQGPVAFYMSKASGADLNAYDGSGDWFKIAEIGPSFATKCSATWNLAKTYSVAIPKSLPSGNYLLRAEQLGIHNPAGTPQFYVNCAQVTVTGGGSGTPSPTVKIPGYITGKESGYTVNIYNNFCSYTVPGPAVWSG